MLHNRKIVFGGVSLTTKSPNVYGLQAMEEARNEIEALMEADRFLESAKFQWIGLIFRYGVQDDLHPRYQRVNKKYGDLSLSIEVDNDRIRLLSKDAFKDFVMLTTLKVLLHVAEKYKLPSAAITARYHQLESATK